MLLYLKHVLRELTNLTLKRGISEFPSIHTLSSTKGWNCVALAVFPIDVVVEPVLVYAGRHIHPILQCGPGYPPCAIFLRPEIVTIEISLSLDFLGNYLRIKFP